MSAFDPFLPINSLESAFDPKLPLAPSEPHYLADPSPLQGYAFLNASAVT